MNAEQLKILIYEYLWLEEGRLSEALEIARVNVLKYPQAYYALKYYEALLQVEYFRAFSRKISTLLTN